MIDQKFIDHILQKGKEAQEKVQHEFEGMSSMQLNWKPSAESWSIAQCLDHLVASHNSYFSGLEEITSGKYRPTFWEKYSPFTKIWGWLMKDQLQEQVKRKMKAPKKIRPSISGVNGSIVEDYGNNLAVFLKYISNCKIVDLDKTIITSPIIKFITYSLRDAFQFLIQHEHRHINQAIRVKANGNFPKN